MQNLIQALRDKLTGDQVALTILAEINEESINRDEREARNIKRIKDLEKGMDLLNDELKAYQDMVAHG